MLIYLFISILVVGKKSEIARFEKHGRYELSMDKHMNDYAKWFLYQLLENSGH
jgi:hypothetical protein